MEQEKQARILVVGDMHFAQRSFLIIKPLTRWITKVVKDIKPDRVVFLGDTLDRFGNVDPTRLTEATDFFYEVSLLVPIVILIGNHEIKGKTLFMSREHGFIGLTYYWQNTTVVDKQCVEFIVNGLVFQAVPYCPNGRLHEGLNTLPGRCKTPAGIFCHQEIKGCDFGGGISTDGDLWSLDEPPLFCGHIHKYQLVQPNVLKIGSPYQDNFDEEEDKGISLITFTESGWKEKRIPSPLPKKKVLSMTNREYKKWLPEENNMYRITVISSTGQSSDKLKTLEKTKKISADGGYVDFIDQVSSDEEDDNGTETVYNITFEEEIFNAINKDKPHLLKMGRKVFKK